MNIFKFELKAYHRFTITWTLSLSVLCILMLSIFPTYAQNAKVMEEILQGFPVEIRQAIGLSVQNITTLLGFFSFVFSYIVLCGAVQGMNLGLSIFAKEFSQKTADFLLTKPVARHVTMTAKILAVLTSLIITNIIVTLVVAITCNLVTQTDYKLTHLLLICSSLLFVQVIFMAFGVLIAVIVPKIKAILSVSMGVVFSFFLISMLAATFEDEFLRYLSPFSYINNGYIIEHSSYEWSFIATGIIAIIMSLLISYRLYTKKDIHTV